MNAPTCHDCGAPMVLRTARRGPREGLRFYGCSNYPRCVATCDADEDPTYGEDGSADEMSPGDFGIDG